MTCSASCTNTSKVTSWIDTCAYGADSTHSFRWAPLKWFRIAADTEHTAVGTAGIAAAVAGPADTVSGTEGTIPCRRSKSRRMG